MPTLFPCEIHTPHRPFYTGQVEAITLTLSDGEIGVYAHHCAFTAPTVSCILCIKDDKGEWRSAFITDGILEVNDHKAVLLVDSAEWPQEIDNERALAAKQEAEKNLETPLLKIERERIKVKLRRAEFRLRAWELR